MFEPKNIIEPLIDFVKQCPFLSEYKIDMDDVGVQKVLNEKPDGAALDYTGSIMLTDARDLNTRRFCRRQANFSLWLLRRSNHDVQREEISNFLYNFEQWVEYCQAYNLTPKLSETYEGKIDELMYADNGMYFSEWEGEESSLYVIQLHIQYENRYKEII